MVRGRWSSGGVIRRHRVNGSSGCIGGWRSGSRALSRWGRERRLRQRWRCGGRRGGGCDVGWEPHIATTFQARELVLPHTNFGTGGNLARREQVDDMARADFGGTEVKGKLPTVGQMMVAVTPSVWQGDGTQAPKTVEVGHIGGSARQKEDGRLVAAGWTRKAVGKEGGGLECKGVEGRRQVGGTQQDAGGGKGDAPKALDVGVLLRRVRASEAKLDLAVVEELTKVVRYES